LPGKRHETLFRKNGETAPAELLKSLVHSPNDFVAVFKAFLDASGHHRGSSLMTMAACVARYEEWKRFEIPWRKYLLKSNSDGFHAKDPDSDDLRGPLLNHVKKARIPFAVVISVDPKKYFEVTSQPFRSRMGGPLAACAFGCAHQIHNWIVRHGRRNEQTIYAFEAGDPGLEFIHRIFTILVAAKMRQATQFKIAMASVVKKSEFPELQPADFLAHCKSTGNRMWLHRWKHACDVVDEQLTVRQLKDVSDDISMLIKRDRAQRKAERRVERKLGL